MILTGIVLSKKAQADVLIHINLQINSCDQNLNRCCEIIELNSEIQGQLFTILNETSQEGKSVHCLITNTFHMCHFFKLWLFLYVFSQFLNVCIFLGGHYAGVETIKTRLLPWLGTCFSCATSGRLFETNLSLTQVCRKFILRE